MHLHRERGREANFRLINLQRKRKRKEEMKKKVCTKPISVCQDSENACREDPTPIADGYC